MREIEDLIKEYCAEKFPAEPTWVAILYRGFRKIAASVNISKSLQLEIGDHLRNSFEAHISKGHSPEEAWQLAREKLGDPALLSREIYISRTQSRCCLWVRILALIALYGLLWGSNAPIRLGWFIQLKALCCLAACAAAGFLFTRKRDADSLRKYALVGAWLGLLLGIIQAITVDRVEFAGMAVSMILLSVFYGLFLAAPSARGLVPVTMIAICHVGMLIPLVRFGILLPDPRAAVDAASLKTAAIASMISILVGLVVFDIRRLRRRLAGVAVFGMFICYCQILSHLHSHLTGLELVLTTSIPLLTAVLIIVPLGKLQSYLLHKVN
jgi:hypothetical protein